jgi:hypothetical protein
MPEDETKAAPPRHEPARERLDERPPRLPDEHDDLKTCPRCGKHVHRDARICYGCAERFDEDQNGRGRFEARLETERARRDTRAHRGTLILVLGILSIVVVPLYWCSPVAVILGLCAWVMGHNDRRAIAAKEMDPEGKSTTTAGWVCGMIGTALGVLELLSCLVLVGLMVHASYQQSPNARPIGAPPPRKARMGQPKRQPPPVEEDKAIDKAGPKEERNVEDK